MSRRIYSLVLLFAATLLLGILLAELKLPVHVRVASVAPPARPATNPFGDFFSPPPRNSFVGSSPVAPRELLLTSLRLEFSGVSLPDALEQLSNVWKVPIQLDAPAMAALGPPALSRIRLSQARRPAYEWMRRILLQADPDGRLRLTFAVGSEDQPKFLVTTQQAANERYLFAVPSRFLITGPDSRHDEWYSPLFRRMTLNADDTSLRDALHAVTRMTGLAVGVNGEALVRHGLTAQSRIAIHEQDRTALEVLRNIVSKLNSEGAFQLAYKRNEGNQRELYITEQYGHSKVWPQTYPSNTFPLPQNLTQQAIEAQERAAEYQDYRRTTFGEALQYFAARIEARVRVDREALSSHGVWPERRIVFPSGYLSAEEGLRETIAQSGGYLGFRIDVDELHCRTVLVTDRRLLALGGPNYAQLMRSRPFTGLWELASKEPALLTFGERLRQTVDGDSVNLPLTIALQLAVGGVKIPLQVLTDDLVSVEISPDTIVRYEPAGREVRAVLYDLLTQADGQKSQRLIYCYQQRPDGEMTLLVTTRDAAERAGRSIPFDFSLVSDDD